jgi:predicted aminopeptidase
VGVLTIDKRILSRSSTRDRRLRRLAAALAFILLLTQIEACYYVQAARGQMDLLNKRRALDEVIDDDEVSADIRARLVMVREARQFSIDELMLPDNDSYRSYADLQRDYVVWNVFAAPEFALQPKRWCYPVAGCVAYRGYFSEDAATRKAEKLDKQGFDTTVGGVSAYSTLGRFSDPVLNTMMRWSDADLVATLFHELAHQKLYIKGDTAFNESFATAVADIGLERWLASRGQLEQLGTRQQGRTLRREVMQLVDASKGQLRSLYESGLDEANMRKEKERILQELSTSAEEKIAAHGSARNWLAAPLNNARLASLGLYEGNLDAFRTVFRECEQQLPCFYQRAEELAQLAEDNRRNELQRLGQPVVQATRRRPVVKLPVD